MTVSPFLGIRTTYSIYSSVSLREESAEIPARFIVSTAWFKVFIKSRTSLKSLMGAFFCFFCQIRGICVFQKLLNELFALRNIEFFQCDVIECFLHLISGLQPEQSTRMALCELFLLQGASDSSGSRRSEAYWRAWIAPYRAFARFPPGLGHKHSSIFVWRQLFKKAEILALQISSREKIAVLRSSALMRMEGICVNPANRAARSRRSPAINS